VKKHARDPAPEATWTNGGSFPLGGQPPHRYPTVTDFQISVVESDGLGSHMQWRSDTLGLLTDFRSYHHLEQADTLQLDAAGDEQRLADGWRPVGTPERPYLDLDQGFVFTAWADDRFVYVEHGDDEPEPTMHTWYRVPVATFEAEWAGMLQRLGVARA
jgi:hypothetical protein